MKNLKAEDFKIITPPSDGDGDGPPGPPPPDNTTPWDENEPTGEPKDDKGTSGDSGEDGEGTSYDVVEGGDMASGGGIISEEDSKQIQGDLGIPEKLPTMSKEEIRDKLKKAMQEGDAFGDPVKAGTKTAGSGVGDFRAAVAELVRGKIDWKRLLKKFIGSKPTGERQYLGSRRWLHSGDYMWGSKEKLDDIGQLVAAVDVSGSMSDEEIVIIMTEIKSLVRARGIDNTTIIYFHDEVEKIVELKSKDAVKKYQVGSIRRGGTRFLPPLEAMNSYFKQGKLELAVFLTDGVAETELPKPKFVSDFIWVILNNPTWQPPWGNKVVYIKSDDLKN